MYKKIYNEFNSNIQTYFKNGIHIHKTSWNLTLQVLSETIELQVFKTSKRDFVRHLEVGWKYNYLEQSHNDIFVVVTFFVMGV